MPFNRILVPFDNSKLSFKALDQAIEFTLVNPAEIFTLHVITEIPLPNHYSRIELKDNRVVISPLINQIYEELRTEMMPVLENIKQVHSKPNISITTEIRIGDPAETIVNYAKQNNIDLIVMGSIGHKGLSGMFRKLGSVARKVAEEVSCPIFIVR